MRFAAIIKTGFRIKSIYKGVFILIGFAAVSLQVSAQSKNATDTSQNLTLQQCIDYAIQNQPALMQSLINISITKKTNDIALSAWLPQVNFNANLTHYFQLPTSFATNQENPGGPLLPVNAGLYNNSIPELSATETIFNPSVLYAASSAHLYVKQSQQASDSTKIELVASVSKAFYNLLLTIQQISVYKEDTARLAKNLRDTYHQYVGGIVDKTDYKEATITLNNSLAQLKQANLNVTPQYSTLKQLMGFPPEKQFAVQFDTTQMLQEIAIDTTQQLQYQQRIEYQELQTAKSIQSKIINYYRFEFLPNLSAFYDYNYEFENNSFSSLYSHAYPYSLAGLTLSIPIFTGLGRIENVQKAKLQEKLLDWDDVNLKSTIYTQYETALANYKSNLYDLHIMQTNVEMGKDVYSVVSLQYKQGIVPYLNVITAESDLITSEIGYLNALFQLLSSKIDLEKAMGTISTNH